ncbi:MAG: cell surface protein [Candidatus Nealsonbacteria bacterium]|nr:cell surface protein [Candidatus Nealsonbacteria bacterium]
MLRVTVLATMVVLLLGSEEPAAAAEQYLGPCALAVSKDAKTLYVANHDARQVSWVALPAGKVTRRVDMPAEPTGLLLSPDAATLIVTCAAPKSTIAVLDAATGKLLRSIPAGHTATGAAISPDGKRLYVCNRFDNDVSVIDLAPGGKATRVKAVREPVAAAVTPDGKTALVANHLPNTRTDPFFMGDIAPMLTFIDAETLAIKNIPLPRGSINVRGLCVSPDGKYAYVTHLVCNFELTPVQVDVGWINSNVVSVVDVQQRKIINTVGLDETFQGAGNPWGVACTADGKTVCVTHAGSHELSVVHAASMAGKLYQMFTSTLVGAIAQDPRAGTYPPRRIELPGKGPRGLAVVGSKVYIAEFFSDTLAVVDLEAEADAVPTTIALGPKPQLTLRRRGQLLFHDASICYQHWQSCTSCHPDARTDALNWDLMNDGVGNFKNTKSMILVHRTPPMMAEGVRKSAEEAVRAGLSHILFADRPEEEAAAIDEYLKRLKPVASPHLVDGQLSPAAQRGKKLFEDRQVGCLSCHPAPLYTDLRKHNVGTRSPYGFVDDFDTPTLIEVWRSAPYLHDGRYLTVKDLLVEGKHGKQRGRVEKLSESEIADLVEFVLSL